MDTIRCRIDLCGAARYRELISLTAEQQEELTVGSVVDIAIGRVFRVRLIVELADTCFNAATRYFHGQLGARTLWWRPEGALEGSVWRRELLATENGVALASTDRDFSRFHGLRWINPLE